MVLSFIMVREVYFHGSSRRKRAVKQLNDLQVKHPLLKVQLFAILFYTSINSKSLKCVVHAKRRLIINEKRPLIEDRATIILDK